MKVEVSSGELLDKFSILELKLKNITDDKKLINVRKEFASLSPMVKKIFKKFGKDLIVLYDNLCEINGQLWNIEDDIRECERHKQFGDRFIELARAVYFTNDKRSDVKKLINKLTGSGFIEEKSYENYQ